VWSLLPRKLQLTLIIGTGVSIAWSYDAAYALITGSHPQLLSVISLTVTIVGSLLTAALQFSWRWIWRRWPFIQPKTFPDLNGTWEGTFASTWTNPETEQPPDPIPTIVTIRQRLFRTDVSVTAEESESRSTRVFLEPDYDRRRFRLWYSYNNDPKAQHRHRSSPHEGVAFLNLDFDADPNRMTGRYYTERKTTGDMDLSRSTTVA
jgi:SMODS-associating 2TM, beta-strand rich effector domain